jgi:peroxiredoxin
MLSGNIRWVLILVASLMVGTAGLIVGKMKEKDYVENMYARRDFMLLDEKGEFFQLKKFPDDKLLLLIFTPDELRPSWVKGFKEFSAKVSGLQKLDIEVMMITRTNREIVRNFKNASGFRPRLLLDPSGTVGRHLGIWENGPAFAWGYALIDNRFQLYWAVREHAPLTYPKLMEYLQKLSAEMVKKKGGK